MKNVIYLFLSLLVSVHFSCSDDSDEPTTEEILIDQDKLYFPPIDSEIWETISVTDLGWDSSAEQPLYDFLEEKNTKAFIILKNGKIVIEKYFNGALASDDNPWYSTGKTLTAFTVGVAQQEGLLNINEPSYEYLGTQWAAITVDQEQAITIKNHLTMTTGLDYKVTNQNCTDFDCLRYLDNPNNF